MSDTDPLTFRVLNEVGIIHQLANAATTAALPRGMSVAQFSVLNHFVRLKKTAESPANLALAFQVSRPSMTTTLMRMERNGLVAITPNPDDGRGKLVAITEKGRAMRDDCVRRLAEPIRQAELALGSELLNEALPLLIEIREKLDALRD